MSEKLKQSDERNCETCANRYGWPKQFWRCHAVGLYCSTEAQYPSQCGAGADWKAWQPRAPMHRRIIRIFTGAQL